MAGEKRVIVLDLETQKAFSEIDRSKPHLLKISVVGIHDSLDDAYLCFEENELVKLEERLKGADLIVGFNIIDFDMRVLGPCLLTDSSRFRVLDLMVEFQKVRGHRASLQSLAQPTLNLSKSGTGLEAIDLYREGRMEELKKYCLDDVRITKELYEYGLRHKKIFFYSDRDLVTYEVPIDWSDAAEEPVEKGDSFPQSLF